MLFASRSPRLRSGSLVALDDERALDPSLVGAKAAALARAATAGLPVLPGFVLSTSADIDRSELSEAWTEISQGGLVPLVVRSSSTAEDGADTSMAGRFRSVVGVTGWDAFESAVAAVQESAHGPRAVGGATGQMAVLVQPQLDAVFGGIMFGVDPVSGERHVSVSVVEGGPDRLVSGLVNGQYLSLGRGGRSLRRSEDGPIRLSLRQRAALVRLARAAERRFGGPQDMEWGLDRDGKLWLFQSRPITAAAATGPVRGAIFGPGPVAETFPHALTPLEEDLWLEPLTTAVAEAFALTGAASRRRLERHPAVVSIGGRVAADLQLFGYRPTKKTFLSLLDLRPPVRRLSKAWSVGRLRAVLPTLSIDLLDRTDQELARVPALGLLSDEQLLRILANGRQMLIALHGYEILAGALVADDAEASSAASIALRALAEGRMEGLDDQEIVQELPWVLALTPPSIAGSALPGAGSVLTLPEAERNETPSLRENLRLRTRWVQELTARTAMELGRRLEEGGVLEDAALVAYISLTDLEDAVTDGAPLRAAAAERDSAPLPSAFRLAPDGSVIAERPSGSAAVGAGGGRVAGTVRDDDGSGDVLVVRTLDPDLAPSLDGLTAIVSETGSPLSHLAILAREMGIATVVGFEGATTKLLPGDRVMVDGTSGEVEVILSSLEVPA